MKQSAVIVVGAGGHAIVIADALLASGRDVIGFVDADRSLHGRSLLGIKVLGDDATLVAHDRDRVRLANGIGGAGTGPAPGRRERIQGDLEAQGWRFTAVRHPTAIVAGTASIADGAQLLAGCIVQPNARIGRGAIVNTRAVVEHDAEVGDYVHVATGAVLCGHVVVGRGAHIGAGAVVRQGVRVGDHVVVGIGAAVVGPCEAGVFGGVPARRLDQHR